VSAKLSTAGRRAVARAARVKARATVIDGKSTTVVRTVTLRLS
jgi:hypothetical protein